MKFVQEDESKSPIILPDVLVAISVYAFQTANQVLPIWVSRNYLNEYMLSDLCDFDCIYRCPERMLKSGVSGKR